MKTCKKIALIMMLMMTIVISSTINVYAGLAEITLKASSTEVHVGDKVTISFNAKCGLGVQGIDGVLKYDKTKLKLLTEEGKAAGTGYMDCSGVDGQSGEYKLSVIYNGSDEAPKETNFATLEFEVLSAANVNDNLTIKLTDIEFGDSLEDWGTLEDSAVTIKVVKTNEPTDKPTEDPSNKPTEDPTDKPTEDPSNKPTEDPSDKPTENPSDKPTNKPSDKPSNNTTTGGNNTNKDNSTANKDIPKAGLNSVLATGIVTVTIVAIIMYRKNNKYRDII